MIFTAILFFVVLSVLVIVHEAGHFFFARLFKVRVEEFGLGYPPRVLTLGRKWGTAFTLNALPFGGFVRIFGENGDGSNSTDKNNLHFSQASRPRQATILFGGILFNALFAWLLFSLAFIIGFPMSESSGYGEAKQFAPTVIALLPDSPAAKAGLKSGDRILAIDGESRDTESLREEISNKQSLNLTIERDGITETIQMNTIYNEAVDRNVIGINLESAGIVQLPLGTALVSGATYSGEVVVATIRGLGELLRDFAVKGGLSENIAGPVGVASMVGAASRLGLTHLIVFVAIISINLAVMNLIPFPALDGGRLLFVGIEAVTRRKIHSGFALGINAVGFFALIALMLFVTYRDIIHIL